jgi:poly(A) polymerase
LLPKDSTVIPNSTSQRNFAIAAVGKLCDAGFEALWAGGCVRDRLLGQEPQDYDVATNATPDEVRKVFGKRKTLAIGAAFGVIVVLGDQQGLQIDVATFRSDSPYSDGRHPDAVTFSTAEEDAKRRDFTINGMFFDPLKDKVIDYVGGSQDIQNRMLRAIGNPHDRIGEDKLRMLRAVRFAAIYGLTIDEKTLDAIRVHAGELSVVSAERIASEIRKMLAHPQRKQAVNLLVETDLLQQVFKSDSLFNSENSTATIQLVQKLRTERFETALAAVLLSLMGPDPTTPIATSGRDLSSWCKQWKLSNEESKLVVWLLESLPCILTANDDAWPAIQPVLIHTDIQELLSLADAVTAHWDHCESEAIEYCRQQIRLPIETLNPQPLVSGTDLLSLGLQPGPSFKEILNTIREQQLLGKIDTQQAALKVALSLAENYHR